MDDICPDPSAGSDMHEQIVRQKLEKRIEQYEAEVYAALSDREQKLTDCLRRKMKYADIARELASTPGAISMAVVRLKRKIRSIAEKIVEKIL